MSPLDPTTPDPDRDQADEVVSAYVDGEATAAEIAAVEGDPQLLARAAAFRLVSEAVGSDFAPDPDRRNSAIAAALDSGEPAVVDSPTKELPVARLDEHRDRRQRNLKIASIAAAILVVVLVAVPVVRSLDSGGSDQQATVSATAESSADEISADDTAEGLRGGLDGAVADEALPLSPFAAGVLEPVELGAFAQADEARAAVDRELRLVLAPTSNEAAGEAQSEARSSDAAGDFDSPVTEFNLADPCPGILAHQNIDSTALVWWGRYVVEDAVHDFIVFERVDASDSDSLHGFIEVTTDCRIVETGVLEVD